MKTLGIPWRLTAVVLACVALFAPPALGADDEAAALLAKHKAFVGWELGDGSIKTLTIDGAIAARAKDGSRKDAWKTHELAVGIPYRMAEQSLRTGSTSVEGFSGSKFWYSGANGFTVPNMSDSRGAILARLLVFAEATSKLPATVHKHDTLAGAAVAVLREAPPSGKPIDLYVDPATGAYKRFVYDPDGTSPTTVDIDAYAEALPGKKVVSTWRYHDSTSTHYYDKIVANAAISSAQLEPPAPSAKWTFGKSTPIKIESAGERAIVEATVNGVAGRFLLDTGSYSIDFSDKFADRAGIKRLEAITAYGIGGSKRGSTAKVDTIAFSDGSILHDVNVSTGVDFGSERIDGLFGFDFLAGAIVDLDFDNAQLSLYDPATTAPNDSHGVVVIADLATALR
jgi:hypothetical protein